MLWLLLTLGAGSICHRRWGRPHQSGESGPVG